MSEVVVRDAPAVARVRVTPRRTRRNPALERVLSVGSPFALLGLWEAAAAIGYVDTRFFPAPSAIIAELGRLIESGELWTHLSVSIGRIVIGFLFGAIPGIIIGLAMGMSPTVRAVLQPLVRATFPIPKLAILPLFILMFGLGEGSKYAILATSVVYLVLINTYEGVRDLSKIYLDVGHNFGANRRVMFFDVALPGAMPQIFTGLQLGLGVSLIVIVAAEFVGARSGIGYLIWNSWQIFAVEKMYAGLMVSAVLGIVAAYLFVWLEKLFIPWRRSDSIGGRRRVKTAEQG